MKWKILLVAVGCLAQPMAAHSEVIYDFQIIEYPGVAETQVFGINERGQVAGNGLDETGNYPFVYDVEQATITDVPSVTGYASTSVLSISESGILAGTVESLEGSTQSGFIRKQHGEDKVFSHPNARSTTVVRGVNNRGLVTGYRDARFFVYGFIYDPVRDDFTDIPLGWLAIAQGINSQGEVVGSGLNAPSNICPEFIDRDFSFFRAVDGSMKYFQVNGWRTRARGINDAGAIAGWAVDPDSGQIKSFVVSLDGSDCQSITVPTADLVEFPESYNTIAQGITNSGMISGQVENFDDNGNLIMRGFVAQPQ